MKEALLDLHVFALINADEIYLVILDGAGLAPLVK